MKTLKFLLGAAVVASITALASCDHHKAVANAHNDDDPTGTWVSAAPMSATELGSGATKTLKFDFQASQSDTPGAVTYTALYVVPSSINGERAANDSVPATYQVTATIKGTWSQDVDDHDDYLLTFDTNSLSVAGIDAPGLGQVTDAFVNSLAQFTAIEDVETTKDGKSLSFETKNPEVKYQFTAEAK